MALEITDSHTHLDSTEFDIDRAEVIQRARERGVTRMLTVGAGFGLDSSYRAVELAEKNEGVWASVGVHPNDAALIDDIEETKISLLKLAAHPRVVAIGETGLDFFRDKASVEQQMALFEIQIEIAIRCNKPLIIHSRKAGAECFSTLVENNASIVGGVFHCFQEDSQYAAKLAEINFLVSFPGPLTFKNAEKTRDRCRAIPLSQIMVETDAPFMSPEPNRGIRCEPAFVADTLAMLASVKGITVEEAAQATTANALRLFKGMS